MQVFGDWNGDGKTKTGIFRNGLWILDANGNGIVDNVNQPGGDLVFQYTASPGDVPVVGDWNGDGRTKTGVFRNGVWILDVNGDGVVNYSNLGVDKVFQYTATAGDQPVIGDWNGDGRAKTGVFRNNGVWILDVNGDGVINYSNLGVDKVFQYTATAGDLPVVGDWNGDGKTKTGVFRNNGVWIIDVNGDGVINYANLGVDKVFQYTATAGDLPVIGDWNGSGTAKTGVFRNNGVWIIDVNGDGVVNYANLGADRVFQYTATPGDKPLVGRW
jgi:predicted RNA-binding protein